MKINENPKCINKNAGHLDLPTLSREKCPPSNENPAMGFCRGVDRDNIFGLKIYSMLNARNTKQFFWRFSATKKMGKIVAGKSASAVRIPHCKPRTSGVQDADNAERAPACWPSAGHSRAQCRPVTAFGRHSRAQWRPSAGERGSSPSAVLHCLHLGCGLCHYWVFAAIAASKDRCSRQCRRRHNDETDHLSDAWSMYHVESAIAASNERCSPMPPRATMIMMRRTISIWVKLGLVIVPLVLISCSSRCCVINIVVVLSYIYILS